MYEVNQMPHNLAPGITIYHYNDQVDRGINCADELKAGMALRS